LIQLKIWGATGKPPGKRGIFADEEAHSRILWE